MTSFLDMSGQIRDALERAAEPMTVGEIVDAVHRATSIRWQRTSVEKTLTRMVACGLARVLDARYEVAS